MLKYSTKIMIVDDHPIVRCGIARLIEKETDMEVCGEFDGSEDIKASLNSIRPDVLVLDISLKNNDGLALTRAIRVEGGKVPIIILSMHENRVYVSRALRAGANGYVVKSESSEQLVEAIREVRQGRLYIRGKDSDEMLRAMSVRHPTEETTPLDLLSDRERQIFLLIGQGYSTQEIADQLEIKVKTVETYRSRIKDKLEINSPSKLSLAAIEWATREGLTASSVS